MGNMITLSEYCSSVRDGTHDSPKQTTEGRYLITSKHISNGRLDLSTAYKISIEDYNKINKRSKVEKWDLLMSMIGTVGRLYVVQSEPNYAIKNLALFKIGDEWKAKYLYYYLSTQPVQDYFNAVANGTSQHFVALGYLRKLKIPNWNIDTIKIIKILNNYDKLIEINNKRIKLLEQMAEELYKEWFVRFRFPGYENVKFENGIPEGWKEEKLSNFGVELSSGSRPKGGIDGSLKTGVPSFGAEVIGDLGVFDFNNIKYINEDFYEKMNHGKNSNKNILIYKDGAYIGKTTMFMDGFPFDKYCINEHVFFLEPMKKEYKNYLYFTLHRKEYFELMQLLNKNSAQPGLTKNDIGTLKIKIPDKDTIIQFNQIAEKFLSLIFKYSKQNRILELKRDSLLPRLMNGKLSVEGKEVI